jgi:hypothetical protein
LEKVKVVGVKKSVVFFLYDISLESEEVKKLIINTVFEVSQQSRKGGIGATRARYYL